MAETGCGLKEFEESSNRLAHKKNDGEEATAVIANGDAIETTGESSDCSEFILQLTASGGASHSLQHVLVILSGCKDPTTV